MATPSPLKGSLGALGTIALWFFDNAFTGNNASLAVAHRGGTRMRLEYLEPWY